MVRIQRAGHNFGLHLRDQGFPVEMVHVGIPVEERSSLGMEDAARRFVNRKAEYYQHLADLLERDQIDGLIDETTIGQLATLQYELDARGRMRIEPKEKARARGIASPDRAEALMLALGEPAPLFEYRSGRELERRPMSDFELEIQSDEIPERSAVSRRKRTAH